MAFVPIVSSSPPPMLADEVDDVDNFDVFDNVGLDEDDDSASFDLTGLSEKLHSIPKEAIHVVPKEVVWPEKSTNLNEIDILQSVTGNDEKLETVEEGDKFSNNVDENSTGEKIDQNITETSTKVVDCDDDNNAASCKSDEKSINGDELETQLIDEKSISDDELSDKVCSEIKDDDFVDNLLCEQKVEGDDFEASYDDGVDKIVGNISSTIVARTSQCVGEKDDDDFGDFADFECCDQGAACDVPPLNLDDDVDNGDDFGDFDSVTNSAGWATFSLSPRNQVEQILVQLQLKLGVVVSSLFVDDDIADVDPNFRISPLDFDGENFADDEIWRQIHNIQSTAALTFKWKDTLTRSKLFDLIKIDPKNVNESRLFSKYAGFSENKSVPAFASGLGVTLEPIKAASINIPSTNEDKSENSRNVELEKSGGDLSVNKEIISERQTTKSPSGDNKIDCEVEKMSPTINNVADNEEVRQIVNSFPLLDFMQSPIIAFPPK